MNLFKKSKLEQGTVSSLSLHLHKTVMGVRRDNNRHRGRGAAGTK